MRREHASRRHMSNRILLTILGIVVVLLLILFGGIHHATSPVTKAKAQSVQIARKYAGLKTTDGFYWTNLDQTYYTVAGKNNHDQSVYIIVPQKGGNVRVLQQNKGMSRNQALGRIWAKHNPKKVISAALSVFNGRPAWVISYMNQKGQLCYETLSFKSGKVLQAIENI
ncbi:hypothetical protein IWT140_00387 [Secundilactobacillus pentosiphilus]|uniref:Cell wall elongation regulator TseB-like domain-containing protein n=2 Tax=Secundilactobacillus pentosiphilus TaxID=1714682 RepID=A0A1Z5IM17_9LACO|nr:DUF5590 domain-containing protein [Secundilactobacillus pentosiphilus]GAX02789.1 hypothetical protein IWT140_00387 [Secundilactobacillus pentosiphilus]GAX05512.1 hypothetical protein IWT25_00818 [Secundilactobacillus pentosiphilus]